MLIPQQRQAFFVGSNVRKTAMGLTKLNSTTMQNINSQRHFAAHLQGKNREPALQKSCKTYASASSSFSIGRQNKTH
jgi:hypothetical protein